MIIIRFSTKTCAYCRVMARAKTLEHFVEKHPDVKIISLECEDENNEAPDGSIYETNYELSDDYEIRSFPSFVFETDDGGELARHEGSMTQYDLEKIYKDAMSVWDAAKRARAVAASAVPK